MTNTITLRIFLLLLITIVNANEEPITKSRRLEATDKLYKSVLQYSKSHEKCLVSNFNTPPKPSSTCWNYNKVDPDNGNYLAYQKGCDYLPCQEAVCECDPYCCNTSWDVKCIASQKCSVASVCCDTPMTKHYQHSSKVKLKNKSTLTNRALYFLQYEFGPNISPKGDCVKAYGGYLFVGWYKGGIKNRHVMLSRSKINSGKWIHIEFPHQHVGFHGDHHIGDSHNTIALGIYSSDDSIHLLYDMHAYSLQDLPNNYFHYQFSVKGAALVDDEDWNLNLFYDVQNFLNPNVDKFQYERLTYPSFFSTDDKLFATFRFGGDMRATMILNEYNGTDWSEPKRWNTMTDDRIYGIYGGFFSKHDRIHMCFSRRTRKDKKKGYKVNRGIYYAYSEDNVNWYNYTGHKLKDPISKIKNLLLFDPAVPGDKFFNPKCLFTENGSTHFIAPIIRDGEHIYIHYYKGLGEESFNEGVLHLGQFSAHKGIFLSVKNTIYLVSLHQARPAIHMAYAGNNDFELVYYSEKDCGIYRSIKTYFWVDNETHIHHLFIFGLVYDHSHHGIDRLPIEVLHFILDGDNVKSTS